MRKPRRAPPHRRPNIGLYGGSFDPIHLGHLAVAEAALRRFRLDRIYFIPIGHPPLKSAPCRASYADRYAMVALACAGQARFVPSLAEAGRGEAGRQIFYSVDTVRRFRREFPPAKARLYFVMGADSFLQIRSWRKYRMLLELCDFIVASRPGFSVGAFRRVIPSELLASSAAQTERKPGTIALRRTSVYVLDSVSCPVSATQLRRRLRANASIRGLVPASVEEYITKQALYR